MAAPCYAHLIEPAFAEDQGFAGTSDTPPDTVCLNGVPHIRKPLKTKASKRPKRGDLLPLNGLLTLTR